MAKLSPLTIINDRNLRGVIAPAKTISKKLLEDIIDFVELSSPAAARETEARVREADRENSWIASSEVERRLRRRMRRAR